MYFQALNVSMALTLMQYWTILLIGLDNLMYTLYASNLREARSSRLHELELKLSVLDDLFQQNFVDDITIQYDPMKKDIDDILNR